MSTLCAMAALQAGIVAALKGDTALVELLDGPKVFDHTPERARFPYLTLGQSVVNNWGTATEEGQEHLFTLHVWARGGSRAQTHAIMAQAQAALNATAMAGHRLVTLALQRSETRQEPESDVYHARMRFRAVSEPLG